MARALASVGVDAPCEATVFLERSLWGTDGKQPTRCLDQAPLEQGLLVHAAAVEIASSTRGSETVSSLGSRTEPNDDNVGGGGGDDDTVANRTRRRLPRRPCHP